VSEFNIYEFINKAVQMSASDIHLRVGKPPVLRISSEMEKSQLPPLTQSDMEKVLDEVLPVHLKEKIIYMQDCDFSFQVPNVSRFRVNYHKNLNNHALTFRMIPHEIPTFSELKHKIIPVLFAFKVTHNLKSSGKLPFLISIRLLIFST